LISTTRRADAETTLVSSIAGPGSKPKMLWHQEGIYQSPTGPVPVLGFPFLRKPRTHKSFVEIAQLGEFARRARERMEGLPALAEHE
jgi:hypothetical protein